MPFLIILLIVVPLLELWILLEVGGAIGVLPTIGLLLLDSVAGAWLMRQQGRAAWRRLLDTAQAGRPPAKEAADGGLVLLGGAFLLTPGFLTDVVGFLLLIPPTRALVRRYVVRRLTRGAAARIVVAGPRGPRPRRAGDDTIDGSATDL